MRSPKDQLEAEVSGFTRTRPDCNRTHARSLRSQTSFETKDPILVRKPRSRPFFCSSENLEELVFNAAWKAAALSNADDGIDPRIGGRGGLEIWRRS